MTDSDREIVEILKELFRNKKGEYIDPDEHLREWMVKASVYIAIICTAIFFLLKIFGLSNTEFANGALSTLISFALTLLFVHLNVKSKNPSLILYSLTWLSLMVSFWLA